MVRSKRGEGRAEDRLGEGGGGMCKGREEEGFSREFCRFADYYLRAVRCSNSLKIST